MKSIKKILLSIIVLLLASELFAESFRILNFNFVGTLSEKNVLSVTETIEVEFSEARHGIYRTLPTQFEVNRFNGKETKTYKYRVLYTDVNTYADSSSTESGDGNTFSIKIGDANSYVNGKHTYQISYETTMFDDGIDYNDFFYYSVLGPFWDVDIDNLSFRINFEKPIPDSTVFDIYSGAFESNENGLNVTVSQNRNAVWGKVSNIGPRNAVTLYADLPQGYFVGAKKIRSIYAWIVAILTILYSIYTLYLIFTTHRDKPVETVEFYPPEDISPADVGFIIDQSADDSDIISLIPYMAQKGYITIKEENDKSGIFKTRKMLLEKKSELPENAPAYMVTLFDAFFKTSDIFDMNSISPSFATTLDKAKKELKEKFSEDKALYNNIEKSKRHLTICTLLTGLAIGLTSRLSYTENLVYAISLFPIYIVGLMSNSSAYTRYFRKTPKVLKRSIEVFVGIMFGFIAYDELISDCTLPIPMILILLALLIIVSILNGRMISMTPYNIKIAGKLKGLKTFIRTAELPRLEVLMKENPSYYYDVLPYAIAFGLGDKWAKQFKNLSSQVSNPSWYTGSSFSTFDTVSFTNSFSSQMTKTVSAARASSGSSGSSGGGSSGGGGGGGGGGSW